MTNWTTAPALSDADLLAEWAVFALKDGRYELAVALTRLAAQAQRISTAVAVPMAGSTREETPARPDMLPDRRLRVVDDPRDDGTQIFARLDSDHVPDSRRCEAKMVRDGIADICRGVVFWDEETGWRHVDTRLDGVHAIVVPPTHVPTAGA